MLLDALRPLSDREFRQFQTLVHREIGIFLPESKKALVVARLSRRLRALDLQSFGAYYDAVEADRAERTIMLDSICTNETRFFREPRQFDYLEQDVLPRWRAAGEAGARPEGPPGRGRARPARGEPDTPAPP